MISKKKILFIEDDPDQITVVRMRLEMNSYKFVSASDGEEGLNKAYEEMPDLILLDIMLSKINGLEVCRRLKHNPDTHNIPVIIMTAAGEKDIDEKCYAAGADGVIRKPYDPADLVEKLKSLAE